MSESSTDGHTSSSESLRNSAEEEENSFWIAAPVLCFVWGLTSYFSYSVSYPGPQGLSSVQDDDVPQKDIIGRGHRDQMFAVKRSRRERR
ncbi:hypothetical protein NQZ68_003884 [Scomber scombrus]|uniref:Transmembrane protein n=1 Tax=Scomber scombrus TaxID=13677 RepID=A0AAV1MU71_SCOSC